MKSRFDPDQFKPIMIHVAKLPFFKVSALFGVLWIAGDFKRPYPWPLTLDYRRVKTDKN
jgi:hypothetical protein